MKYLHASLLLHQAGKEVTVENLKKVLDAAGANFDEAKAKALVASLENVNIEEAISKAPSVAAPQPTPPAEEEEKPEEEGKKEKTEEEEEEEEKKAAEGLGNLFG